MHLEICANLINILAESYHLINFLLQITMFPGAEELWVMLEKVKKAGFLPYLLLTPDPNGPLSAYMMPPIHTHLEPSHMDQLKTIRDRLNISLDNLVDFIFSGSILAGWTK